MRNHFQKNTKIKIAKLGSTYRPLRVMWNTQGSPTVSVIRSQYESSGQKMYTSRPTLYGDGIVYKQEFTNRTAACLSSLCSGDIQWFIDDDDTTHNGG